jgi:hypothetical protein
MPYKGRPSHKSVERGYPHIVEIAVPLGGLGKRRAVDLGSEKERY